MIKFLLRVVETTVACCNIILVVNLELLKPHPQATPACNIEKSGVAWHGDEASVWHATVYIEGREWFS